ncbi:MAG: response regulator [Cyanobacteria bacterium P01_D01_bin.1]
MNSSFLYELIEPPQDGRAHIVGGEVEWCVDVVDGHMLFATHSLQYLTAFESMLPKLGYESALPTYWRLMTLGPYKRTAEEDGLKALGWTNKVLKALVKQGALNTKQAKKTLDRLSEEAIATLLGLESATITWYALPTGSWHLSYKGIKLTSLIRALIPRLQLWQALSDRIVSPYQRPYCDDPYFVHQVVPNGTLPQPTLGELVRLMQGATIRQLAQVTKLDELKLAQLLYPYIEHRVVKLWPPVAPLDRLPWLPTQAQTLQSIDEMYATSRRYVSKVARNAPGDYSNYQSHIPYFSSRSEPAAERAPVSSQYRPTAPDSTAPSPKKVDSTPPPTKADVTIAASATAEPVTIDLLSKKGLSTKPVDKESYPAADSITLEASEGTPSNRSADSLTSKYRIVCIDDNQLLLNKIDDFLDAGRFELHSVLDPLGSITKICSLKPDLILLDITMPRIDGHNLCKVLRRGSKVKHTPIVMISSNTNALNKAKAKAVGATDYLEKPFSKSQLTDVMNIYLPP